MIPDSSAVIRIQDLTYRCPGYNTVPVTALNNINLEIRKGEKVVISGPSGSGKTSLIRCISGLIPNSSRGGRFSGVVEVGGINTQSHTVAEISQFVGTVFQDPDHQIVTSRVDSEIAFGLENLGVPADEIELKISHIAERLGIRHLLNRETSDLSWGEKQRVAIASVLVMNPEIVVMDEPFSGLDPEMSATLITLLDDLNRHSNITLVLVEHRIEHISHLMDRIVVMNKGEIVYDGPPAEGLVGLMRSRGVSLPDAGGGWTDINDLIRSFPEPEDRTDPPGLELRNVTFRYPASSSPAVDNVSLKVYGGEITVIVGSNGSGKSTLAKHLNGVLKPDSGKIFLYGKEILAGDSDPLSKVVGLVSQHADYQLFEESIIEELSFGPGNLGMSEDWIKKSLPEVISSLSLGHIDPDTPPLRLSVGEKQRVAIGSILMMKTRVVVLDEPTLGLDWGLKKNLAGILRDLCADGGIVLIVTHDLEFASVCADRVVLMNNGRLGCQSQN